MKAVTEKTATTFKTLIVVNLTAGGLALSALSRHACPDSLFSHRLDVAKYVGVVDDTDLMEYALESYECPPICQNYKLLYLAEKFLGEKNFPYGSHPFGCVTALVLRRFCLHEFYLDSSSRSTS